MGMEVSFISAHAQGWTMAESQFSPPEVALGETVYWYANPHSDSDPQLGWVSERPGRNTVTLLVFAPGVGFVEKTSVRHRDDPGLHENANWRSHGGWEYSEETARQRRLSAAAADMIVSREKATKASSNGKR